MISIIIPYVRPKGLERLLTSIRAIKNKPEIEIVAEEDKERIGCPKMVKRLVDKSRYDLVCFLADDCVIKAGFFEKGLKRMSELLDGWGLISYSDGWNDPFEKASHWLANKKLLPYLDGEFFHIGFIHSRCDKDLADRVKLLIGRYGYIEDQLIIHYHPSHFNADTDEFYQWANRPKYLEHDRLLYRKREAERNAR